MDHDVDCIKIEDPYIRTYHQCQNLVRFCELVVKKCTQLRSIELTTINSGGEQANWLNEVQNTLLQHQVNLIIVYSPTLHDRQITLSNGWIIKIGRGLDYFKAPQSKFSLGTFDLDLRPCHETTVDIFHSNTVTNK